MKKNHPDARSEVEGCNDNKKIGKESPALVIYILHSEIGEQKTEDEVDNA
jgi:hypothetical protein